MAAEPDAAVAAIAEDYYDSPDADAFYFAVWGGEDIHIGIYDDEHSAVRDASRQTVEQLAALVDRPAGTEVLDLGAGYGGSARLLARNLGWKVDCLNISEVQNERNRQANTEAGLDHLVDVHHGSFEAVPAADNSYDVVWSQDAFLHSGNRGLVLDEIARVLRPGGEVIFTDPMQSDDCPDGVLDPILERIHLESLASPGFYREEFARRGFVQKDFVDLTHQLRNHYATVREELRSRDDLPASDEYVQRMINGLGHWVDGADRGHLAWGFLHFAT